MPKVLEDVADPGVTAAVAHEGKKIERIEKAALAEGEKGEKGGASELEKGERPAGW